MGFKCPPCPPQLANTPNKARKPPPMKRTQPPTFNPPTDSDSERTRATALARALLPLLDRLDDDLLGTIEHRAWQAMDNRHVYERAARAMGGIQPPADVDAVCRGAMAGDLIDITKLARCTDRLGELLRDEQEAKP